jgi:cytochrome c oxidase subunit 3
MPALVAEPELVIYERPKDLRPGGPGGGGPRDGEPDDWGGGGGDDDEHSPGSRRGGPSVGMLGMLAMLVSITALFATIVIAFLVRSQTRAHWQAVALPWGLWPSTAVILASSVTLELARRAFEGLDAGRYSRWLLATFVLALVFLGSQAVVFRQLVDQGVYFRQNPHSSLFYIITGSHALHVIGGMAGLFYLIYAASGMASGVKREFRARRNSFQITAVYWHFLDFLWMALFGVLLRVG